MQQKINNKPVTEKKLKEILKEYPTKVEVEVMFEKYTMEIDRKAREYRDQILNRMDQTMGELVQHREDNLFRDHDIKNLKKNIEAHDGRISKLEDSSKS